MRGRGTPGSSPQSGLQLPADTAPLRPAGTADSALLRAGLRGRCAAQDAFWSQRGVLRAADSPQGSVGGKNVNKQSASADAAHSVCALFPPTVGQRVGSDTARRLRRAAAERSARRGPTPSGAQPRAAVRDAGAPAEAGLSLWEEINARRGARDGSEAAP